MQIANICCKYCTFTVQTGWESYHARNKLVGCKTSRKHTRISIFKIPKFKPGTAEQINEKKNIWKPIFFSFMRLCSKSAACNQIRPGRKFGNRGNHGNHGNSRWTRELQILAIQIKKAKHKSKFDKVWEKKNCKINDFPWFPGIRFEAYNQKRKLGNLGNSTKTP